MRRSTESPDNKPSNIRLSSPVDQWQSRCSHPNSFDQNYGQNNPTDNKFRPNQHMNPYPGAQLGPNFAAQRFFTPRPSYYGSHNNNNNNNNNPVFSATSSAPNLNQPFYSNTYANYDSVDTSSPRLIPSPLAVSYGSADTNRPVYSTPDTNGLNYGLQSGNSVLENLDVDQLKKVLLNVQSSEQKTESTSSSGADNSTKDLHELVSELKKVTEESDKLKKSRKEVQNKIIQLNEELKEYEKKISFRSNLQKIDSDFELKSEDLDKKRNQLIAEMENLSKSSDKSAPNELIAKNVVVSRQSEVKRPELKRTDLKRPEVTPNHHKPSLKRPNVSTSDRPSNPNKKVCFSSTEEKKSELKTTPKSTLSRPHIKKTPISPKPNLISTDANSSLKVNQISRHSAVKPTPNSVTSGVRTSRPVKMVSSRIRSSDRSLDALKTTEATETTETTKNDNTLAQNGSQIESLKKSTSADTEVQSKDSNLSDVSDNEMPEELEGLSQRIESEMNSNPISYSTESTNALKSNDSTTITKPLEEMTKAVETETNFNDLNEKECRDESTKQTTTEVQINDKTINENQSEGSAQGVNGNTNKDNVIEIVDIDSADEELGSEIRVKEEKFDDNIQTDPALEEERQRKVTEEANNLLSIDSRAVLNISTAVRNRISSSEESENEDRNCTQSQSPFKTPTAPAALNKRLLKYTSFDPIVFEPTVNYTISSFKPTAGPKSKTNQTSVVLMKSFKDYLFVAFMDCSVRRYHIENKTNIVRFEGHERLVLTMIIIKCSKSADNFILYTGGKDKKLRAFNAMTGQLFNSLELNDEILCLDYNWSHVFAGLSNGTVCKIAPIHESTDSANKVQPFVVNAGKRIAAIISVKPMVQTSLSDITIEPIITVSINKLRIINTSDSVRDEDRILHSHSVNYSVPIIVRTFGNYLIISHKCPPIKDENKTKKPNKSKILMYDLSKDWTPFRTIDVSGLVVCLDLNKSDLILNTFEGKIQCICLNKKELKWISYSSKIMACVKIGERLVLGNDSGLIDVIFLDQKMIDCETCGVTYAREIDFKHHIQTDHAVSESDQKQSTN